MSVQPDNQIESSLAIQPERDGLYLVLVDNSQEFSYALKKAASLAHKNNSHVALLCVLEQEGFQPWGNIEERVRQEQRAEAEKKLYNIAGFLNEFEQHKPAFLIEEGSPREVLVRVLKENPDIRMLVLGDGKGSSNPLIHYFVDGGVHEVQIPLLIVPDVPERV